MGDDGFTNSTPGQHKGTVKYVTQPKMFEGQMQIGFMLKEHEGHWINAVGEEEGLKTLLKEIIKKGNYISYVHDGEYAVGFKLISAPKIEEGNKSWEEDIVNFESLLSDAHTKFKGRFSIETTRIDYDMKEKWAVFKATVRVRDGEKFSRIFEAHGDATQDNCQSSMIKPHFLRMAETRAIARALRWATNNAKVAEEEK